MKLLHFCLLLLNFLYFQEFSVINDEAFQRVIQRLPAEIRNRSEIVNALYEIRHDLNTTLRDCANDVAVKIYIDEYLTAPITLMSGSGRNIIDIIIDSDGNVKYRWEKKTWEKRCKNARQTVRDITKNMVSRFGSALAFVLPRRFNQQAIKWK